MTLDIWLAYVATILALMSTPGPSHLLMISNSMSNGAKRSTATAAGDLTANSLQMLAAGLGLTALLASHPIAFEVIKWVGITYLVWMGIRQIRRSFQQLALSADTRITSLPTLWLQGFTTSAANPKAIIFFASLFPQFLNASSPLWQQLFLLGSTYLLIDGAFLMTYGLTADWLSSRLSSQFRITLDRFSGFCLIIAALLLAFKSVGGVQ